MATLPTNIPANGILTPDPALDPVLTPISDHAEQLSLAEAGVSALETTRNDRWYPKFHIASNGGWINDPNGLCRYNGRWHVFYQLDVYKRQQVGRVLPRTTQSPRKSAVSSRLPR